MESLETKNPFINGILQAVDYDPAKYIIPEGTRGQRDYVMSRSSLMEFEPRIGKPTCPRKWLAGRQKEDTSSTLWGTIMDALLLSPEHFDERFIVQPLTYPATKTSTAVKSGECNIGDPIKWNNAATFCKEWKNEAEQTGKIIVSVEQRADAELSLERLKQDDRISEYVSCSQKQVYVTAEYRDKATGIVVKCKALLDLVPNKDHVDFGKTLADFKTTQCAENSKWKRSVFDFDYHVQAAWFLDIFVAATGQDRLEFYHILQENSAPFETGRRFMESAFLEHGRSTYLAALQFYCQCLKSNFWPGYDDVSNNANGLSINGWTSVDLEDWMIK